jgi:hypothetical protein
MLGACCRGIGDVFLSGQSADVSETAPSGWAEAIARSPNPFLTAMTRYARAPIAFVREVLHAEPDPWQADALRALAHGHTRLSIRSGHGVGKSCFAAWAMTWFANTRAPFKVGVTAPSAPQLFDALWPELRSWFGRLPDGWRDLWDLTTDRIALKAAPDECFITARTARADKPEALQGLHSANIMLVADEASGVDEAVFEAAGGSMSSPGAITVLLGNPTRATGFFWRTHMLERDRWYARRVGSNDSTRVDPKFCQEIADRYGLESNAYRVRVLGEFPLADSDTLIGAAMVDEAMKRDVALDLTAPELWGVDVARFGTDSSVLLKRRGFVVPEMPRRWRQIDTMTLAGAIKAEFDLAKQSRPALIVVDVIGIGAGVVDRLGEQGLPVLGVNVAESASTTARFARLRDELWFRAREWLEARHCRLPYNEQFRDDLCGPRYSFLSDGRLQVESKNAMRSRGLSSPDIADAFCLTFAEHGLAIAGGQAAGLFDSRPVREAVMGME